MAYNLLEGKRGIIFGVLNSDSLAWKVAEKAKEEGAKFTISNTKFAARLGETEKLAEKCNSSFIACDATDVSDIEELIKSSMEILGGKIDFILHSIAMSANARKGRTYDDLNYTFFKTTLDISAMSFHKVIQTAKNLDAMNEYGSILALSYIAAQRTLAEYNDMADAKALLESIARSFGYIYGRDKNVRINTISQSPTITKATSGMKTLKLMMEYTERMSPLGNATAEECADYCITLFSDLTRKVTMQNLYHDGGFSSVALSNNVMDAIENCLGVTGE